MPLPAAPTEFPDVPFLKGILADIYDSSARMRVVAAQATG